MYGKQWVVLTSILFLSENILSCFTQCLISDGQSSQPGGEGGKQITVIKTYLSPWDKALGVNPQEATNLSVNLLDFGSKADLCSYKSFNR